ncbi:hypothetical protein MMC29_008207 [Sticta canariensis]|nr:hypothetical protein [Sticta canariensis]
MADALCGPSNSLQSFQKHTSIDRTLQQDRLATRESSSQGFRSSSGLNVDVLDAEFEAFQSGRSLENGPLASEAFSFHRAAHPLHPELAQTGTPDWASDFQRLHIIDTQAQPTSPSPFREQEPLQPSSQGGWHKEFSHQQNSIPNQNAQQQALENSRWYMSPNNTDSASRQVYAFVPVGAQQRQLEPSSKPSFDDAALERAFDAVTEELKHSEKHVQGQETEDGQETNPMDDPLEQSVQSLELRGALPTERIGSDKILDEAPQEERDQPARNDADELARTAGELLDNVMHDQSQKFRESNFLSLMRQLRDREVQVEGDKIVDVSTPLSQP